MGAKNRGHDRDDRKDAETGDGKAVRGLRGGENPAQMNPTPGIAAPTHSNTPIIRACIPATVNS